MPSFDSSQRALDAGIGKAAHGCELCRRGLLHSAENLCSLRAAHHADSWHCRSSEHGSRVEPMPALHEAVPGPSSSQMLAHVWFLGQLRTAAMGICLCGGSRYDCNVTVKGGEMSIGSSRHQAALLIVSASPQSRSFPSALVVLESPVHDLSS